MYQITEYYSDLQEYIENIPYHFEMGCTILCILAILLIVSLLAKILRRYGYKYTYYFLANIHEFDYYNKESNHISNVHGKFFRRIDKCQDFFLFLPSTKERLAKMSEFYNYVSALTDFLAEHFEADHYFAFSEKMPYENAEDKVISLASELSCKEFGRYIRKQKEDKKFDWKSYLEKPFEYRLEEMRLIHNKEFVEKELREKKTFFDTVLQYPLDKQQRESIVKLEDNCQVISSAGSGKTSTSIAKVKYLVEKRGYKKDEILALSYNKATAAEFHNRLGIEDLDCNTFHSLAMRIVSQVEGKRPDVCSNTFLIECFYDLASKDPEYKKKVNEYFAEKASVTQCEHNYRYAEEYYKDRATYGVFCPYTDRNGKVIFTKSEEEKKICVWLVNNGIEFEYERPYHIQIDDPEHRQYKPDFSIFFTHNGRQTYVYYEHFGIDKNGDVPVWFGEGRGGFANANAEYNAGIIWKRNTHRANNSGLLETTSAMFHDGTIFENLESQLRNYGIELHPITEEEKFEKLFRPDCMMRENVKTFFDSFFSLMKSNGKTIDSIMQEVKDTSKNPFFIERNRFLLYEIIKPLYDKYEAELRSNKQIDFVDMIIKATTYLNEGKFKTKYKYILVDEFQDISIDRFRFLQALRIKEPLTKLYCVGDDWQSIYRFSGSDINLFSKFEKHFGFTEICRIETTYRFGNPLIDKSSRFILANENQVAKVVRPLNDNIVTDIKFVEYSAENGGHLNKLREVIASIPANESIMLVGRYNADVYVFPSNCIVKDTNSKRATVTFEGREMKFMSIHAAKGLEADNVIILNCSSDSKGFPSRVADDPILGYVLSEVDNFLFSEERRLYYVGITRAKKNTIVLFNGSAPSLFVNEMKEETTTNMLCPVCRSGNLVLKYRRRNDYNPNEFQIYRCSNLAANCRFSWVVRDVRDANHAFSLYTTMFLNFINRTQNRTYTGPNEHPILHTPDVVRPPEPYFPGNVRATIPQPPQPIRRQRPIPPIRANNNDDLPF